LPEPQCLVAAAFLRSPAMVGVWVTTVVAVMMLFPVPVHLRAGRPVPGGRRPLVNLQVGFCLGLDGDAQVSPQDCVRRDHQHIPDRAAPEVRHFRVGELKPLEQEVPARGGDERGTSVTVVLQPEEV